MKTKFMVASSIGLLGITSMILGATTFASETNTGRMMGWGSGTKITKMMRNHDNMMKKFASTGEAEAFKTAIEQSITNNDYTAYIAVNTNYNITKYLTKDQFTAMATEKAHQQKILDALKNGDYATWKTLNTDNPILKKIDTEAKFKKLQEMESYKEKMDTLSKELGLQGQMKGGMRGGMEIGKGIKRGMKGRKMNVKGQLN